MHTPPCVLRHLGLMVVVVSRLSDRLTEAYGDQTQGQIAERARRAGHQIDRSMVSKALADKLGPKPREATLQAWIPPRRRRRSLPNPYRQHAAMAAEN